MQNSFIKSKLSSFLSSPDNAKTLGHGEPGYSHPTRRPACALRQPCMAPVYPGATLVSSPSASRGYHLACPRLLLPLPLP